MTDINEGSLMIFFETAVRVGIEDTYFKMNTTRLY